MRSRTCIASPSTRARPTGSIHSRLLTSSLDRQCEPHPEVREPAWDGDRIVFAIEDRARVHVYGVPADGSYGPEALLEGERVVTGFDVRGDVLVHTAATATTLSELYSGETQLTEQPATKPPVDSRACHGFGSQRAGFTRHRWSVPQREAGPVHRR